MNFIFFVLVSMAPIALGAMAHSLGGGFWYLLAYPTWIGVSYLGDLQAKNLGLKE